MHYFLHVRLERFYSSTFSEVHPDLLGGPIVIHREKRVLDFSHEVEAAGLRVGMPLSEAKAILRDARFVAWEEEPYRDAQFRWLDLLCEFSDVIEPRAQHEAFVDLTGHPDPVIPAINLRNALTERLGLTGRIGLGSTKWMAELAAGEHRVPGIPEELSLRSPLDHPEQYLADRDVGDLLPIPARDLERLRFLGYKRIGQVCQIPPHLLREQFGAGAMPIRQACRGRLFEPVRAAYPENTLQERLEFNGAISDVSALADSLHVIAQQMGKRLREIDSEGNELLAFLELEDHEPLRLRREFMKPMSCARGVYAGLRLLVTAEKLKAGVLSIRVQMPRLRKARSFQMD
ncbi:MAG TPA: hypothetical protein VM328_11315, partial [Fimbriimonadaceae bacterium]|nr:hypothetical protein [Fimbriimonadaceae bacterium]